MNEIVVSQVASTAERRRLLLQIYSLLIAFAEETETETETSELTNPEDKDGKKEDHFLENTELSEDLSGELKETEKEDEPSAP